MPPDIEAVKAKARRDWDADPSLRAEFRTLEALVAFCVADARGQARVFTGKSAEQPQRQVTGTAVAAAAQSIAASDLIHRQALVRQENIGRVFAGLPPLPIPQI